MSHFSVRTSRKLAIGGGTGASLVKGLIARSRWLTSKRFRKTGNVARKLANGIKAAGIPTVWRRDKLIGNARAGKTLRYNLLCIEQIQTEQKEVEARANAECKTDMCKLANQFQAAVGTLIGAVSASSEREAVGIVSNVSEEAATQVATQDMTSPVNEITRQVQISSEVAATVM